MTGNTVHNLPLNLPQNEAALIVKGEDRPGLVAAISHAIAELGGNIVSLDQHTDEKGTFFQRTVIRINDLKARMPEMQKKFDEVIVGDLGLGFTLTDRSVPKRVAILASKDDACLLDLLSRNRRGEIAMTVPMVVSNHTDVADFVKTFGIPFFHVASQTGPDKSQSESELLKLLQGNVDAVVLARYMQILSQDFLDKLGVPVINIHHSFLPAFIGANPYAKAKERGVKLIGATAHYVTEDLDEGPIIEQDVVRVNHKDSTKDLQRRGADVERNVLSRAVTWHCDDRVIRNGRETIVF